MSEQAHASNAPDANVDLDKIIQQSQDVLADQQQPQKRRPGRQPGWRKNKTEGEAPTSSSDTDRQAFKPVDGVILKQNEIEPLATELVKAPFDIIGWKTGVDITPTDDEARAPSKYAAKLIECYLPDLDANNPKVFNLVALIITSALLALKKLRAFAVIKRAEKKPAPAAPQPKPTPETGDIVIPKEQQDRTLPKVQRDASELFNRGSN